MSERAKRRHRFIVVGALCLGAAVGCRPADAPAPRESAPVVTSRPVDSGQRAEPTPPSALADTNLDPPAPRPATFRRGVSLGLFASAPDPAEQRRIYAGLLDELRALGATDVQLVVRWAQADATSSSLAPDSAVTPSDAVLRWVIADARALGLRVFLLPIVHVERRAGGRWRGTLEPGDWDAWWAAYTRFIVSMARVAQRGGVSLLAVGSELGTTEGQTARWVALIKRVRAIYRGPLTYSANWDRFEAVTFWDRLDVVGVSVYPELTPAKDPDDAALERGWQPFRQRLRGWAAREGHHFLFTEVGYPAHAAAAARPWDARPTGDARPDLQARLYRTLFRVWQADPFLEGLYVWNWFGFGGLTDTDYTPRGKPAADVLRHWYGAP